MSSYLRIIGILLMFTATLSVKAVTPTESVARKWCDANALNPIEGIWEYPEDGARVLIQSDKAIHGSFSITVLSTPDCRLEPGEIIGRLYSSIDQRQFRLEQWTGKDKMSFIKPCDCLAVLSTDGETIRVKAPKTKLKVNLNTILPRFWRIVRISVSNPLDDLPAGMIKVYPGYDHNGSLKRQVRVL